MRLMVLIVIVLMNPIWGNDAWASESYDDQVKREVGRLADGIVACKPGQLKACVDKFIEACSERGKWTTLAMVLCNGVAHDHWDREMNRTYKDVIARARGEFRAAIVDAQRKWIAYRDSRCGTYRHFEGTMWRPVAVSCLGETTYMRFQDLHEIAEAGPLAAAPEFSEGPVVWKTERTLSMDLNCDDTPDRVVFGVGGTSKSPMGAVGWIDGSATGIAPTLVISVPIGGNTQFALCGDDVTLEAVRHKQTACPVLRIDDGRCDGIYVWRDRKSSNWMIDRN